jgi:hypothetical protein
MEISISLIDEVTAVFLWIGAYGLLHNFIHLSYISQYDNYIYILLLLFALYFKL